MIGTGLPPPWLMCICLIFQPLPSCSATTAARFWKARIASRMASSSTWRRVSGEGIWAMSPTARRICCRRPSNSDTAPKSLDSMSSSLRMRQPSIFRDWV